jgi:hypothetical protein
MAVMTAVNYLALKWKTQPTEPFEQGISEAIIAVEQGFEFLTGEQPRVEGWREVLLESGNAYGEVLLNCWKTGLRERLVPLSYNPQLPS